MLFLFFCPASVYQQSFLGGEQTATATTTDASTEQYRNQQCKPIRLATFEFDFKKQRSQRQENDHVKTRVEWKDINHPDALELIDIPRKQNKQNYDEIDFANSNHNEDEPELLSFDCLKNIHSLSRSMHNLINNLNDNKIPRCRLKSQSATSSLNSIPENLNTYNYHSSSSIHCDEVIAKIPTTPINHRNDGRYENSPKETKNLDLNCETPKLSSKLAAANRQSKCNRKNLNRDYSENRCNNDDFRNSNTTVSTSSDNLTDDSSIGNDIETSDSFVNIQFARLARGQKSSSTQSMESTDSFENVSFQYVHQNNCLVDRPLQISSKLTVNQNQNKFPMKTLQTRIQYSTALNALRSPKLDIQSDKKNCQNLRVQETDKYMKNELIKLRHERYINRKNPIDSRNVRSKRYSCYSSCAPKRLPEEVRDGGDKITTRKFSSTDELRDEVRQKPTTRTKRFSLFYTPQPLRKTYEGEAKTGRIACKSMSRAQKSESKRRDGEEAEKERLDKSRRSVMDASTVASRSKSNRQNVHVRPSVLVNANRTKL